ncbi:MAG: hypothetical protein A2Y10_13120 [Planctomycetes bacterium GWF2_41_51]|nr:MAG: hypothetical protein A2Y10_13120 [Planctomycetes bacterium GWF2_41_51]HBG60702.1 hypothetical protein [Candidatus Omnitrophota bacterium]
MKTEIKKSIIQYVELYEAIQEKTSNDDVAIAILQEIGKDKRSKIIAEAKDDELATEKQKNYLKDLGVEFSDSITKKEASDMIEQSKNC